MSKPMTKEIIRSSGIHIALIGLMIAIDNFLEKTEEEDIGTLETELKSIFKKLSTMED